MSPHGEDNTNLSENVIEFSWGQKDRLGGNCQYYRSFNYDGVEYFLYDSVYFCSDTQPELYIGKLVEIYETPQLEKRVKIVWYFRPAQISHWLCGTQVDDNELFLALGVGNGVVNVNALEAIAGKCNVLCISKDSRNPQASNEELRKCDFVFYRTFNVDNCTISERFPDKIAGVEVEHFFDPRVFSETITHDPIAIVNSKVNDDSLSANFTNKKDLRLPTPTCASESYQLKKRKLQDFEGHKEKNNAIDKTQSLNIKKRPKVDTSQLKQRKFPDFEVDKEKSTEADKTRSINPKKRPEVVNCFNIKEDTSELKKKKLLNFEVDKEKSIEADKTQSIKLKKKPNVDTSELKQRKLLDFEVDRKKNIEADDTRSLKLKKKQNVETSELKQRKLLFEVDKKDIEADRTRSINLKKRPNMDSSGLKQRKLPDSEVDKAKSTEADKNQSINPKKRSEVDTSELKKRKLLDLEFDKESIEADKTQSINPKKIPKVDTSERFKKLNTSELKKRKLLGLEVDEESIKADKTQLINPKKIPKVDTSEWFKKLPWEERMQKAHETGSLVLLENLLPSLTSVQIEEIVLDAFKKKVSAKMIQCNAFSSPRNGQALVIFNSKDDAEFAIKELETKCLMINTFRAVIGSRPSLKEPGNASKYFGHIGIDNIKLKQRMEQNAVSTSHYSQPNTVAFDMAMEWWVLQTKWQLAWNALYKQQKEEISGLINDLFVPPPSKK